MKFYRSQIAGAPNRALEWGRGNIRDLIGPTVGASNLDVHVNTIDVGSGRGEIHYHARSENVYIVLEGVLEVCVEGGERHLLQEGEIGFIPSGVVHTAGNGGQDKPVKIIEIYAPAGDDFFELEAWPEGIEPPDAQ